MRCRPGHLAARFGRDTRVAAWVGAAWVGAAWLGAAACRGTANPAPGFAPEPRWHADIAAAASDPVAFDALRRALGPASNPLERLELLRSLERFEEPATPEVLGPLVAGVLDQPVDVETLVAALRALGRFQSRACVASVVRFARAASETHQQPELVNEALSTLTRQTGRTDPGADVGAWERWLEAVPDDPVSWFRTLAAHQAQRAAQASATAGVNDARMAALYRRLLVSLPERDRGPVLAEMIRAETPEVRTLGFDQTTRSVLNGVPGGPELTAAALDRLGDPDPAVRVQAADLLQKLDDPSIGPAAVAALARESAPLPAASILRILVKRPDAGALRDIAAWLDSTGPSFAPAVDAALVLARAGQVTDPDLLERMRVVLSSLPSSRHTPGSVELLARAGGAESVTGLIEAADPRVGSAAARAASESSGQLERVLSSASGRPWLFEAALAGLMRHRPDAEGFERAEALQAPSAEIAKAGLARYAAALPPEALLRVCLRQADLTTREAYAAAAVGPGFLDGAPDDRRARLELVALLGRTRLLLKKPASAVATLDEACGGAAFAAAEDGTGKGLVGPVDLSAPPALSECQSRLAPVRVTALAWIGRVEEALDLSRRVEGGVSAEAWLEALEAASDLPHAPAIEAAVRELFSTRLTPEQEARFEAARRRAARE